MHLRYKWNFTEHSAPPHEQLRYYRNFRGLLGKEIAARIGVSHATIVNYENLKSPFDYSNAIKIAGVLQIDKELLFMRKKKNHLYVDSQERGILLHSLVKLKNQLIQQGRYTDCVDELISKVVNAPIKRMKIEYV